MTFLSIPSPRIRAISSCIPDNLYDNLSAVTDFASEDVQKIVRMAGVRTRFLADESLCSSDLCETAARDVIGSSGVAPR